MAIDRECFQSAKLGIFCGPLIMKQILCQMISHDETIVA